MIAIDTNILVYVHRGETPLHRAAVAVMTRMLEQGTTWSIPWPCLHEFYATVTGKYRPQSSVRKTWDAIDVLVAAGARLIGEGQDHMRILKRLTQVGEISGGTVHDAKIAAICLAHGVTELWTCDRDYSRFPELKVRNPLQ